MVESGSWHGSVSSSLSWVTLALPYLLGRVLADLDRVTRSSLRRETGESGRCHESSPVWATDWSRLNVSSTSLRSHLSLSGMYQAISSSIRGSSSPERRGTLLASYAFMFQIGGLAGAVGLQILQTVRHTALTVDACQELMDLLSHPINSTTCVSCSVNGSSLVFSSLHGSSCPRLLVSSLSASDSMSETDRLQGSTAEKATTSARSKPFTVCTASHSTPTGSVSPIVIFLLGTSLMTQWPL